MEDFGNLRLKTFDGTSDVREFIKRFNIVTAAKELNDDQKAAWVPVFLTGPAMAHYDTLADNVKKVAADTLAAIEAEFTGLENTHFQLHRLHQMQQKEGEKVTDFTSRFQELARKAYFDFDGKDKAMLMQVQYQNNLLPHIKRQIMVKNIGIDFIKTYKLALLIDSNPDLFPPLSRAICDNKYRNSSRKNFNCSNNYEAHEYNNYENSHFCQERGPYL